MWAAGAAADTYRIATFAAPLSRDGPGLLLRDILRGEDASIQGIVAEIEAVSPDILVLTDFDYDLDLAGLTAFAGLFGDTYPHRFAHRPNAGIATGLDIDGNGRTGEARDALGYGRFAGDGGLAVLSRYPFHLEGFEDLSGLLWRDLPGATLPSGPAGPFFGEAVLDVLPVSSTGHWQLPVILPDNGHVDLLVFAATPPVFDGPEDMNGLRARDELLVWEHVLDGVFGPVPDSFVVVGNANLDPENGQGNRAAMAAFLNRDDLQDPHLGQPNADWGSDGPGALRVSYVLPSLDWQVIGAGTRWPAPDGLDAGSALVAGPHRLVWVDVTR